jgi:D-tyrosyl-tRNA(Tyr) deacylase
MRAVVQRVTRASVRIEGEAVGSIGAGMLVLLGILRGDDGEAADRLADRVAGFRFFADADGRMNRSVLETGGSALVVSQFTLAAGGDRGEGQGRRPSFTRAAPREVAEPLCERFSVRFRALGIHTETGRFGERMEVELVNDGPVTFVLDEAPAPRSDPPS